jgi:hypothetical protein
MHPRNEVEAGPLVVLRRQELDHFLCTGSRRSNAENRASLIMAATGPACHVVDRVINLEWDGKQV